MIYLLSTLWFLRQIKSILLWLYLWQLKEYHIGRFLDHFRTYKGKKLFLNKIFILKIGLLFYAIILFFYPKLLPWFLYASWIFILIIIYFSETVKFFLDIVKKRVKKPVVTKKIFILILANLIFVFLLIIFLPQKIDLFYWVSFAFLCLDILSPLLVSGIVLLLQPFTILLRNRIIKKARQKRKQFKNLIVIGITGSYGKTSTKEFLATILEEKFPGKVLKTKEHQNSEIGISQCILNDLKTEHKIFVCEMGAYNKGGIKLLCDIVEPKIGIVTGVNEQHLATFGTMENLLSAEGGKELIDSLPAEGIAFFNGNNDYCRALYERTKVKKFLYGIEAKSFGEENLSGAKIVARELGMTDEEVTRASKKIKNKLPGIEIKKGINGITVIDSSYSANPTGVVAHLEYLKTFSGKKVVVMPCLIELGKCSKDIHFKIGKKISEVCNLAIITTKDRFKEIKEGAGEKKDNVLFLENPKKILEKLKEFYQPRNVVLLEGRVPAQLVKELTKKTA